MEHNINSILKQISRIVAKEKALHEEKKQCGEYYNIFKTLGLQTSEVRLHSAFLAELLNPEGAHGLKGKFLQAFLKDIILKIEPFSSFEFETSSTKVFVEKYIGEITNNGTNGGRLDLLIEDGKGKAIIIENKIYAGDQYNQMLRYHHYANDKFGEGNYLLLYLTLEQSSPSEHSTGNEKINYVCINYKNHIVKWLEHCMELSTRHPLVRETIQQYINNMKDILNIMEESNKKELFKLLAENNEETFAIINNAEEYKHYIYDTYVKPELKKESEESGLIFEECKIFDYKKDKGFFFYKKEWKSAAICMWSEYTDNKGFYWGVSQRTGPCLEVKKIKLDFLDNNPTESWPYGWGRLEQYKDWDVKTYSAMIKGRYTKYIMEKVKEILKEIEKKQLSMP